MGVSATREQDKIKALFRELVRQPLRTFPALRGVMDAPADAGVYVIYDPKGRIEHVGESASIAGRLRGHIANASSYANTSLGGMGHRLRNAYSFSCLAVDQPRKRMLLQSLAIGLLCPRHIGDRAGKAAPKNFRS